MSPSERISLNQDDDERKEDRIDVILAHQYRLILADAPRQSGFRVIALIFYERNNDNKCDDADSQLLLTLTRTANCLDALGSQSIASIQRILKFHECTQQQNRHYVMGTNDEPHAISGSICAERAALLQLRFLPEDVYVTKIVIVTDSPSEISPGMLCREFMSGHPRISPDTPIVLGGGICGNCGLDISTSAAKNEGKFEEGVKDVMAEQLVGCCQRTIPSDAASDTGEDGAEAQNQNNTGVSLHDFTRNRTTIRDLYPRPSLYARFSVAEAVQFGRTFATSKSEPSICSEHLPHGIFEVGKVDDSINEGRVPNAMALKLLDLAKKVSRLDNRPDVHPLQYGAAVLFSDGTFATSYQKKALEYGCTLDAVGQLAHVIEEKCCRLEDGNNPFQYGKLCKDPNGPNGELIMVAEEHKQNLTGNTVTTKKVRPVLLVQADQYGIAHAPFARGRAYLSEHGYRDCYVLVHSSLESNNDGESLYNVQSTPPDIELLQVRVDHLVPDIPNMSGGILNCMCNDSAVS